MTAKHDNRSKPILVDDSNPVVFVTGFFMRHGIAYFDVLLRALVKESGAVARLQAPHASAKAPPRHDQYELMRSATGPTMPAGLSKAVLLVPQRVALDKRWVSTEPEKLFATDSGETQTKRRLRDSVRAEHRASKRADEALRWFTAAFDPPRDSKEPKVATRPFAIAKAVKPTECELRDLWQIVNEFPLVDQVEWWNATVIGSDRPGVVIEHIGDESLSPDDPTGWPRAVRAWLEAQPPENRYLVNLFGTSTSNHLAWYYLAATSPRLRDSAFCSCRTLSRDQDNRRFRPVLLEPAAKDLLHDLGATSFPKEKLVHSPARQRVFDWLRFYRECDDNFVILLLGERGTGKSQAIREVFERDGRPFQEANCALFGDDNSALSHLFGHEKGSYTGADKKRTGLFDAANGGVLFLDEFHRLRPAVQGRLLTTLQTDKDGFFRFDRWGSEGSGQQRKVKLQLVLASNSTLSELRKSFPDDFWDRVNQRVLHMRPFDKRNEMAAAWNKAWTKMRFLNAQNPLDDPDLNERFLMWLQTLDYPGNFRDVERLTIMAADLQRADSTQPRLIVKALRGDRPRWFAALKHQIDEERRLALQPGGPPAPGGVPATPESRFVTVGFKDEPAPDPSKLVKAYERFLAEKLKTDLGGQKQAAMTLKARRHKPAVATLGRWLKKNSIEEVLRRVNDNDKARP